MLEKIKNIPNRILEWWNGFTNKQKIIISGVAAAVLISVIVLAVVLTRPTMVTLITCENTAEASKVKGLLEGDSMGYDMSEDGLTFKVKKQDLADAELLLGGNDIPTKGYDLESVFEGGFSATESDKTKKYTAYLEDKIADTLASSDMVESATVQLVMPNDDGTILASRENTYASVMLKLNSELEDDVAENFAKYVATAVGNDSTHEVTIIDSTGKQLYDGGDESNDGSVSASTQMEVRNKAEAMVKKEVKDVMIGTNMYDNVEVGMNLNISFKTTNVTDHEYYVADGNKQGYKDSESVYNKESQGGTSGTPGTDSNDDTTYQIQDNANSSETISETDTDYALNEKVTITDEPAGTIDTENSSISVVATTYKIYNEDDLKADGSLDGTSFDEFKSKNSETKKGTVDEELIKSVADATGIPTANISIVSYTIPYFVESDGSGLTVSRIIEFVLAALILLMLGFVVFRSTRPAEVVETEPELSVESLLETTRAAEESLEDIGFQEKSETRLLIEKFVDENPEAVAGLLRNWLNDDWE
ncbi:flagellar M-ring protein FliF C-terminal domain-containing protein [Acetitomaculum ruminis]|nr:flagellar M-ring protein FliF C-terminal domain-containing protein [Acetitomaculum ruminis]